MVLFSVRIGTEEEEEDDDDDDDDDSVAVVFSRALWPPPSPVPVAIRPSCIPADRQTGVPPPARRPRAHALLSKHLHTLLRARALFLTPVYLSVCPVSFSFSFSFSLSDQRNRASSISFFLSVSLLLSLSLSLSSSLSLSLSLSLFLLLALHSLSPSLFLPVCARSCCPPLFLLLRSPRRPAPSERTETTPSLSTKHQYITQQRHHTRPRKNEPRADY